MSVVNDVLRDLDSRRRKQRLSDCISFVYDEPVIHRTHSLTVLFWSVIILFICLALAIYTPVYGLFVIGQPDDANVKSNNQVAFDSGLDDNVRIQKEPEIVLAESNFVDANNYFQIQTSKHQSLSVGSINKASSDVALEDESIDFKKVPELTAEKPFLNKDRVLANALIAHPDTQTSITHNPSIKQTMPVRRDDPVKKTFKTSDTLNDMLKTSPGKVWPYIQTQLKGRVDQVDLLALGAQGEQRSGQHKSAIRLYTKLLTLESNEPKWLIGLAISLDQLGETDQALRLYQKSLISNQLESALNSFVRHRIAQLTKRGKDER